jgi:nucleotide-binding universal stress UspA family protein
MGLDPVSVAEAPEPPIALATVVCGMDASPQSTAAARQGVALADEGARLYAVTVWDPTLATHAGLHAAEVAADLRQQATATLQGIHEKMPALEPVLIKGSKVAGLLAAATNLEADLICVASHGTARPAGIVFGSVATAMAHHAPCSVLVARESATEERFPRVVLHAGDGSPDAMTAAGLAGRIAAKHDATVVTLHVRDGQGPGTGLAEQAVSIIQASGREPAIEMAEGPVHRRIVEVAERIGASLIVVGSRGLTGLKALGSVSERVAHRARCSVLVVRRSAPPVEDQMVR